MNLQRDNRILLVDDMPSIHDDFRKILVPTPGSASLAEAEGALFGTTASTTASFQLDCASSGEAGLKLLLAARLQGRPYSMAFVDMRMPASWDGVRTVEELWREDPQLQVVICTAYSDEPLEGSLARLGSPDRLLVLKKPFDPIEVSQMARALVAKRRLEVQSEAHLAHLEQVMREVQEAAAELRRRNHELELLASTVSQDLRSPMSMIGRFSALLSQELGNNQNDKVTELLDRLRAGARFGEELVDGVISLSDIARAELAPKTLDMSQMARELMAEHRQANPGRHVSTSVQDGMLAWGDARLVRMALAHLIDNAWKFTNRQEMAAITVGVNSGSDGAPVFFVRDSGCGFDAAMAGELFTKFQRLHAADEFPGGGIGLVAVGRIVERHRGKVWADSRLGQGTTVYLTLPSSVPSFAGAGR